MGALLALSFGLCLALPVEGKKTYVIWSPFVLGLVTFLFWLFVMQTLDNRNISCVEQAMRGFKDLSSCPSYDTTDASEITLIVGIVWICTAAVSLLMGLLVTGGTALLEWAIDRISRILFTTN